MSNKFNTVKDTKYRVGNIDIILILGKGGSDLELADVMAIQLRICSGDICAVGQCLQSV